MTVKEYEDQYLDAVIHLFVEEYGVDFNAYKAGLIRFFEHPFQKNQCIRIITVNEAGELMGFQSFFYWPYIKNGKTYRVYQSGNSIVSKKARGKGIFQKMLDYAGAVKEKYKIDFLIGFPVEASYKSFISNGWNNPFDLQWYAKVKNPFGILFSWFYPSNKQIGIMSERTGDRLFVLENNAGFMDWRKGFQKDKYRVFSFRKGKETLQVNHKINRRKKVLNEMIIGEVLCSSKDPAFIKEAIKKYRRWLSFQLDISILSFCTNHAEHAFPKAILALGLRKIDKSIHFITKYAPDFRQEDWLLYRSDIDTW
jgi:hypothetical protein